MPRGKPNPKKMPKALLEISLEDGSADDPIILKRMVRRIRGVMGKDAPKPSVVRWMVRQWMKLYEEADSSQVKLGVLRTIAEAICILKPGVGLMVREKKSETFVPKVNFNVKVTEKPKELPLSEARLKNIEMPKEDVSVGQEEAEPRIGD